MKQKKLVSVRVEEQLLKIMDRYILEQKLDDKKISKVSFFDRAIRNELKRLGVKLDDK
jgi:hypothetical protein